MTVPHMDLEILSQHEWDEPLLETSTHRSESPGQTLTPYVSFTFLLQ